MNKVVMITGANAGIGKETARQLALKKETEKIYLACRSLEKAKVAKRELEESTGRSIFEILLMDVSSPESVKKAVKDLPEQIDALIMNAGGTGGKDPSARTKEGVTNITATNLLGHVVLLDTLLERGLLKNVALLASSEAARGVKKMGMKRPELKSSSKEEFASVFDGSFFEDDFDPMQVYGVIKYAGTLWMSSMARKNPEVKFIAMSPGGTRGTQGFDDLPFLQRIMFKYIGMPIIMPLMGLSHSLEKGASRFVDGIENQAFKSGSFYASKENVLTGPLVEQKDIFPDLANEQFQDNANSAIHEYIN